MSNLSQKKIEERKKNIEFWESEVQRFLDKGDIMSATWCRVLANNLREEIGGEEKYE